MTRKSTDVRDAVGGAGLFWVPRRVARFGGEVTIHQTLDAVPCGVEQGADPQSRDDRALQRVDMREAGAWLASSVGVGIEEAAVSNERPIREVAAEILGWLRWGGLAGT